MFPAEGSADQVFNKDGGAKEEVQGFQVSRLTELFAPGGEKAVTFTQCISYKQVREYW